MAGPEGVEALEEEPLEKGKTCLNCRCWGCWTERGFDAERCDRCSHSHCPKSARLEAIACAEALELALRLGHIERSERA